MPRKPIKFSLDFMKKDIFSRFTVKQFDDVTLTITPLINNEPYNVSNMACKIYVGVNNEMFLQDTNITVSSNSIVVTLDRNMLSKDGRAYAEIELTDSNGTVTSSSFIFKIDRKIGEGATIPGSIDGFVEKYKKLTEEFKKQFATYTNDLDTRFNTLTSQQQQDAEVIDARKGETSLKAKMDKIDEQFNTIKSSISVDIPFWEVPTQPNTWATSPIGQQFDMTSEEFLNLFYNPYVGKEFDDGYIVTKNTLGVDESGEYNIYEYNFIPANYERTIILTGGNHGYELSAHFGLARFFHYIINEPDIHEGIRYIRDKVRILCIPFINPWGFSQLPTVYANSNGVNINRNFDYNGMWYNFPSNEGDEWNYKGTEPYSEAETRILRDFYIKYKNEAEWAIDCHTGAGFKGTDQFLYGITDDKILLPKLLEAVELLDERVRKLFNREPSNRIMLDLDSSIRMYYSTLELGLPNASVEYANQTYGGEFNGSTDLTYYLLHLSNYVFRALSCNTSEKFTNHNKRIDNNSNKIKNLIQENLNLNEIINAMFNTFTSGELTQFEGNTIEQICLHSLLKDLEVYPTTTLSDKFEFPCKDKILKLRVNEKEYDIPLQDAILKFDDYTFDKIIGGKLYKNVGFTKIQTAYSLAVHDKTNTYFFTCPIGNGIANEKNSIICNLFNTKTTLTTIDEEGVCLSTDGKGVWLRVLKSRVDEVGGITNFLTQNNIEVVYKVTPYIRNLNIPFILIKDGLNTITTNDNVKPNLKCSLLV